LYESLEIKFLLKDAVKGVIVLTGVNAIYLVVGAHDRGDTSFNSASEGPNIDFVKSTIINVGARLSISNKNDMIS
jgi:hypothetical protein